MGNSYFATAGCGGGHQRDAESHPGRFGISDNTSAIAPRPNNSFAATPLTIDGSALRQGGSRMTDKDYFSFNSPAG
jgi:hypothetical protein